MVDIVLPRRAAAGDRYVHGLLAECHPAPVVSSGGQPCRTGRPHAWFIGPCRTDGPQAWFIGQPGLREVSAVTAKSPL